jgi:hypothetical protein
VDSPEGQPARDGDSLHDPGLGHHQVPALRKAPGSLNLPLRRVQKAPRGGKGGEGREGLKMPGPADRDSPQAMFGRTGRIEPRWPRRRSLRLGCDGETGWFDPGARRTRGTGTEVMPTERENAHTDAHPQGHGAPIVHAEIRTGPGGSFLLGAGATLLSGHGDARPRW